MTLSHLIFVVMCCIPAAILLITAVARLNDIKKEQTGKRWWARRLGLALVAVSMMMVIASSFTVGTKYWFQIQMLCGLWGFGLTWITTPGMPPWWRYISRNDSEG